MFTLLTKHAAILTLIVVPVFAGNDKNYTYLALGDSIAFGYDPTLVLPNMPLPSPNRFIGYPEVVAQVENLLQSKKEVNAACPGQTSFSFFAGGPDNGCEGFRATIGLHTTYAGTQENFAISQLTSNRHINLVTLSIGGNDLVLVEEYCATSTDFVGCVNSQLNVALPAFGQNLARILSGIRNQANYKGTLVIVKNYAPNGNPLFIQAVDSLNQVMVGVGSQFGAKFAESFVAFQVASALFGGDPCKAGLLVSLGNGTCDVHPSKLGRDLLAATVEVAIHTGHYQQDSQAGADEQTGNRRRERNRRTDL